MCTVTYVPSSNGYYLVSNRDEKFTRKKALLPNEYILEGVKLIFPRDGDAGGTWIVLKENGNSLCLLNGAFENFADTEKYSVSRGNIVLQIAVAFDMLTAFNYIDFVQAAPFTLIIVNNSTLFECRWDGEKKYSKCLDNAVPHIWSSATLYNYQQRQKREEWFAEWIKNNPDPCLFRIFDFHQYTGEGSAEYGLVINRNNTLFTVSITGIAVNDSATLIQYVDLKNHDSITVGFSSEKALA